MASKRANPILEGLFSMSGRMRRSEYWLISVGLSVVKIILAVVFVIGVGGIPEAQVKVARTVLDLLFLWPATALMVKHGHDRNRSAAYSIILLLLFGVLGAGLGVAELLGRPDLMAAAVLALVALALYTLIDYGFVDGTRGPNRYGPSPKFSEAPGGRLVL